MMNPEQLFSGVLKTGTPHETKTNQGLSRAWIRCPSGRRLDLLDPAPFDVEITDIALSLSRISRWAGMTATPFGFSVAQHCVLVVQILEWLMRTNKKYSAQISKSKLTRRKWLLAALVHDAPESYLGGDLCGPAKAALGTDGYREMERRLEAAVHLRLGLPAELPLDLKKAIKQADRASAYVEAVLIAGFSAKEAEPLFGVKTPLKENAKLETFSPAEAEYEFLAMYNRLAEEKIAIATAGTSAPLLSFLDED